MDSFQPYNKVAVVLANTIRPPDHRQLIFINSAGFALDSDDPHVINMALFSSNQQYQNVLSKYPGSIPGLNTHQTHVENTPDGGQRFDIIYPLLNGCATCQRVGEAVLGFQFDAQGNYKNVSILRVNNTL